MFDFRSYQWYHWLLFTAFVIGLYWLWLVYLLIAVFWAGSGTCSGSGSRAYRPRSSSYRPTRWKPKRIKTQRIKPHRAPRVRKPRVYKGRWLKNGTYSTYDPVRKQWRNQARHSTWKSPPD